MSITRSTRAATTALLSALPALPCTLLAPLALPSAAVAQDEASSRPATPDAESAAAEAEPTEIGLLRLEGPYLDLAEQGADFTSALLGGGDKPKPFYDMLDQVRAAGDSDEYETILVDLTRDIGLNGVQITEFDRVLDEVRAAGKKTIAYVENPGPGAYRIASHCDEIVMADMGSLDFMAPAMTLLFMRDALDLLGVRMDVIRCGDFKGAVEPYVNHEMSQHLRRHYLDMLEAMNDAYLTDVGGRRKLDRQTLRDLQKRRLLLAEEANASGLVDHVSRWQGAEEVMRDRFDGEVEFVPVLGKKKKRRSFNPMAELMKLFSPKDEEEELEDPALVVLHLSGTIVDGNDPVPGSIVSGPVVEQIRDLAADELVRAVVLRINSPGGSATASEAILLALQELAAEKTVSVSMGTLAASGGYYVTCFGPRIFAEENTITGSIGVFGLKPVLGPMFRRVGLHEEIVALDEAAKMTAMSHDWSDRQQERMQQFVDEVYARFIGHVARSRGMPEDEVLPIAGGRVWSGSQAEAAGLVDEIGGLEAAIAYTARTEGLEEGAYEVRHMPRPKDFFEILAQKMLEADSGFGIDERLRAMLAITGRTSVTDALDRFARLLLDALRSEGPILRCWAMMPAAVDVSH